MNEELDGTIEKLEKETDWCEKTPEHTVTLDAEA